MKNLFRNIIKDTIKRMGIQMPNYQNIPNYRGYSVKISPISKLRKFFDWGYFSGGNVNFKIEFEFVSDNENDKFGIHNTIVYLSHPLFAGMEAREEWKARDDEAVFIKDIRVDGMGELRIFLGEKDRQPDGKNNLFTTNVIHPDVVRRDILMIVLGLFGGFIITSIFWVLGLI